MKWRRGGKGRIEDRRGAGGGLGGGGIPFPIGKAGGGLGGILVLLLIVFLSGGLPGGGGGGGFGIDPGTGGLGAAPPGAGESALENAPADDDEQEAFVRFVVGDVEDTWRDVFAESGSQYEETTVVLYEQAVQTQGCGNAPSSVGPFYCPADRKVYIDLTFFRELSDRFGAPGDFARAYVIAHEIGHHVQNLLGVSADVNREQQEDPGSANELSVRLELQADCLAGIYGHTALQEDVLQEGDLEEGLGAAAAVGDDRLQEQAGRRVDRESWTHGSSEQRTKWFRRGFDSGDPRDCDTFGGDR